MLCTQTKLSNYARCAVEKHISGHVLQSVIHLDRGRRVTCANSCHVLVTVVASPACECKFHVEFSDARSHIIAVAVTIKYDLGGLPVRRWVVNVAVHFWEYSVRRLRLSITINSSPRKRLALVDGATQDLGNALRDPGASQLLKSTEMVTRFPKP